MTPLRPLAAAAALVLAAGAAHAADGAPGPVVVELFTSQGCYSCPPAERFVGDLAGQKSVLALEFHVDYWDELVYGAAGKWKDPFSSHAHTLRQRAYNVRIRGRGGIYTPQKVIDGRLEAVGSQRLAVLARIRAAEKARGDRVAVEVSLDPGAGAVLRLAGRPATPAKVWLVRFLRERTTRVLAGENKGKTLTSHHIVTELRPVGSWAGAPVTIAVPDFALKDGEGCAVLVQPDGAGPILGAAPCPAPGA